MWVTEKIDGTNAAVVIEELDETTVNDTQEFVFIKYKPETDFGQWYAVSAQSRHRVITPEDDNYGFAAWVRDNAVSLVQDLGSGYHFGEWFGLGIQRGYGLQRKRFALFNSGWWFGACFKTLGLEVVPLLYRGRFSEEKIRVCLEGLRINGSEVSYGFARPEGVVVYHEKSRQSFKITLDVDGYKG